MKAYLIDVANISIFGSSIRTTLYVPGRVGVHYSSGSDNRPTTIERNLEGLQKLLEEAQNCPLSYLAARSVSELEVDNDKVDSLMMLCANYEKDQQQFKVAVEKLNLSEQDLMAKIKELI